MRKGAVHVQRRPGEYPDPLHEPAQLTEGQARQAPVYKQGDTVNINMVFFETYGGKDYRGEGTVPRVSATPHDLSNDPREMYAATRHGPLQNADAVLTHLAGLILRLYLPLTTFLAPNVETVAKAKVSVAIEDFYWSGEPVVVKAKPDREGLGLELP